MFETVKTDVSARSAFSAQSLRNEAPEAAFLAPRGQGVPKPHEIWSLMHAFYKSVINTRV